jgi:Tfp pilus assembly PilM family ATPase
MNAPAILSRLSRLASEPPRYLGLAACGVSVSEDAVVLARVEDRGQGPVLAACGRVRLASGIFRNGAIADPLALVSAFRTLARGQRLRLVRVGVAGVRPESLEAVFRAFDTAGLMAVSAEDAAVSTLRAVDPFDADSVLLIDVGRSSTRLASVREGTVLADATVPAGGRAFALAGQKHLGLTEAEAGRVAAEEGLALKGDPEYTDGIRRAARDLASALVPATDALRTRTRPARAMLVGEGASVRGLPEHLSGALGIPVFLGDPFAQLAPRGTWLPPMDLHEVPGYASAIGLALDAYA